MSGGRSIKLSKRIAISLPVEAGLDPSDLVTNLSKAELLVSVAVTPEQEIQATLTVARAAHQIGGNLAGGCLRDAILGKIGDVKDYDIFVYSENGQFSGALDKATFGVGKLLTGGAVSKMREEVKGLIKYNQVGVDIVIVDCKDILETVQTFDASICQVWTQVNAAGNVEVWCSNAFCKAMLSGVWYHFVDVPTSAHLDRLKAKYGPYLESPKIPLEPVKLGTWDEVFYQVLLANKPQ